MSKYNFMEMNEAGNCFFIEYHYTPDAVVVGVYSDEECNDLVDRYRIPEAYQLSSEAAVEQLVSDIVRRNIEYL